MCAWPEWGKTLHQNPTPSFNSIPRAHQLISPRLTNWGDATLSLSLSLKTKSHRFAIMSTSDYLACHVQQRVEPSGVHPRQDRLAALCALGGVKHHHRAQSHGPPVEHLLVARGDTTIRAKHGDHKQSNIWVLSSIVGYEYYRPPSKQQSQSFGKAHAGNRAAGLYIGKVGGVGEGGRGELVGKEENKVRHSLPVPHFAKKAQRKLYTTLCAK